MMKFAEFREELKQELRMYYKENEQQVYGTAFALMLFSLFVLFLLFVFYAKVMVCLTLIIVIIILLGIMELKIRDIKDDCSNTYMQYHLLYDIKYFCIRLLCYPCGLTSIGLLIWIIFK